MCFLAAEDFSEYFVRDKTSKVKRVVDTLRGSNLPPSAYEADVIPIIYQNDYSLDTDCKVF